MDSRHCGSIPLPLPGSPKEPVVLHCVYLSMHCAVEVQCVKGEGEGGGGGGEEGACFGHMRMISPNHGMHIIHRDMRKCS